MPAGCPSTLPPPPGPGPTPAIPQFNPKAGSPSNHVGRALSEDEGGDLGNCRRAPRQSVGSTEPLRENLRDGRPQADRHPLHRHRRDLPRRRRRRWPRHAVAARRPEQHARLAGSLQPDVLAPRHSADLLLRDADGCRWLRQLPGAADDRRPRYGVPAPERVQLLGLPARRHVHVLQLLRRQGARWRLVRVCAADRARSTRPGSTSTCGRSASSSSASRRRPRRSISSSRSSACARRGCRSTGCRSSFGASSRHRSRSSSRCRR